MTFYHDPSIHMLAQPILGHQTVLDDGLDGGEGDKSLSHFINLASSLDSQTVLSVVSPKLFDHFTIWDLMLAKAKLHVDNGALGTIVNDTALVLCELKILIENCLNPILVGKVAIKKKSDECIEFDDMMTMAMGLDTNLWLKRNFEDISYRHNLLNVEHLFPPKRDGETGKKFKIKKEVIEEEEDGEEEEEEEEEAEEEEHKEDKEETDLEDEGKGEKEKDLVTVKPDEDDPEYKPEIIPKKRKLLKKKSAAAAAAEEVKVKKRKRRTKSEIQEDKKKGEFTCSKCGKNYLNFTAWYKHMENSCASRAALRVSIRTIGDKYFCAYKHCHVPKKPFLTKDEVHDHWALNHVDEEQKIVPCFLCEQKFATIGAKKVHMSKVHVKQNPLMKKKKKQVEVEVDEDGKLSKEKHLCLKCGQSMNKESGKKHEEKCNGMYVRRPEYKKVEEEYFCTVGGCNLGYGFNSMYGLRKHFHGKHTREEEKFFQCDYCDEKFSFKTTRNKHITEKHMKNHVCDICGKGFGGRGKMMQHRFLHTGEKPYGCSKCDYHAAKRSNLEAHMESKHSIFQQKNFICAICNKQFVTMGRVRRHMAEIHADGVEDGDAPTRKKKRQRNAPPPSEVQKRVKRVVVPVQQQQQHHQVMHHHHQQEHHVDEQDAAVHYLQSELVHPETQVITVRPLY